MGERDNNFTFKDSVTLRDYFESRLGGIEKAADLAAKSLEKRLESMNEFRDALKNQASFFVTRNEIDIQMKKLNEDIRILREYKSALEGKASSLYVTVTLTISVLSFIVALMGFLLKII